MRKSLTALALAAAAALTLTGCGKQIDMAVTGATQVPGTTNLFRFCDGATLIYFSNYSSGPDEYEFIVYDGCSKNPPSQTGVQNLPDNDN